MNRSSFTTILILIPMEEFSSIIYRALESGFKVFGWMDGRGWGRGYFLSLTSWYNLFFFLFVKGVQYKYFQCVPSSRQLQGLMINLKKSEIIPINVQRFSSVLNCKVGSLPSTHLGLLRCQAPRKAKTINIVIRY